MPVWHIKGYDHPLTTDEQDGLFDLLRLNQRRLVAHFGSPTAQRVGRAYAPGGAREVFLGKAECRMKKSEPVQGRKAVRRANTAG
jgi:hypothetical protein